METNFAKLGQLTFENPDVERFPALSLAREAGEKGGTLPAVMNAANEVAVDAFCDGKIRYDQITATVAQTMSRHEIVHYEDLVQVLDADDWARIEAARIVAGK